jgi:hypothetical protein
VPIFRPSTLANLTIIFDEEFSAARESNPDLTLAQFVQAQSQVGSQLGSQVPGVSAYLVTPLSVDYTRKTYRFADTLLLTFACLDAPFAADSIRAATVALWMDNVAAVPSSNQDFGAQRLQPVQGKERFIGTVDEWDEDIGEGIISIEARSYVGLLLDKKAVDEQKSTPLAIDTSQPLDEAVQDFIQNYAAVAGHLNVVVLESDGVTMTPAGQINSNFPRGPLPTASKFKPNSHGKKRKAKVPTSESQTYWEMISELCMRMGFICYVRLDKLVISTNSNSFDSTLPSTVPGPPLMLYGQNLSKLSFKRRMAKSKAKVIQVVAYCPDLKKSITVQWPDPKDPSLQGYNPPNPPIAQMDPQQQQGGSIDVEVFTLPPIGGSNLVGFDQIMKNVAMNLYKGIGKNTLSGMLATDDSWSFPPSPPKLGEQNWITGQRGSSPPPPSPTNPDLYALWPGSPIEVNIRPLTAGEPAGPPASMFKGMSQAQIVDYLVNQRGFSSRDVATALAAHIKSGTRDRVFRTKSVNFKFTEGQGLTIEVEFTDYIQAHDDPTRKIQMGAKQVKGQ